MPPDPRDWLPEGHLAWAVRRSVRELDLAPFLAAYRADGQGKTAYHPRMMVALILYCYCKGIRSSRAIEMATWDDVGARVICGGRHPDHATKARCTGRAKERVEGRLGQRLGSCAREGLVRGRVGAGWGGAGGQEREGGGGEGPGGGPGGGGAGQGPGQGRSLRPARRGGGRRDRPAAARPRPLAGGAAARRPRFGGRG